jgi:hypothetical protein
MLPAPTSIAATPSAMSGASWTPAVPPPPVGGAPLGIELGDGLPVAADDARRLAEGLADGRLVGAGRVVDGLALTLDVLIPAVPLAEPVGLGEPAAPGENVAGVDGGDDPVQADAEASTVKVAKPAAVNLAPRPFRAMAVRIFAGPPVSPEKRRGP